MPITKTTRRSTRFASFRYFLEVFAPNTDAGGLSPEEIPHFVNDHICRTLAGVPLEGRPEFLKIPFFGPAALEELVNYDPSVVVGILGGSSGTNYDTFKLLAEAQKHGARVALFGRKIKDAEHPLTLLQFMRRIVEGELSAEEAVRAYHSDVKCYLGSTGAWGDSDHEGYVQPPVTPGHEFVGEVVALGEGAGSKYGLELGDHATSEQIEPCWE